MKKPFRISLTVLIVLAVAVIAFFVLQNKSTGAVVSEDAARWIGEHSIVYVQLGCRACEEQEKLFGGNWEYINAIDCFDTPEKCANIKYTPTWVINGEQHIGLQSIEELKELTGYEE